VSDDQIDMFAALAPLSGATSLLPSPSVNEPGKVQRDGMATSRAAAIALFPKSGTQRRTVLDYIGRYDPHGLTDRELQQMTRIRRARTRRSELVEQGWVIDSGRKRRLPDTKNLAEVWILSDAGREQWVDLGSIPTNDIGVEGD